MGNHKYSKLKKKKNLEQSLAVETSKQREEADILSRERQRQRATQREREREKCSNITSECEGDAFELGKESAKSSQFKPQNPNEL